MTISLLAIDIDLTLTNQSNSVSPRNTAAVHAAIDAGVRVVLATGRGPLASRSIWNALDLHGPAIVYGGAMIVDIDSGEPSVLRAVPPEIARDVLLFSKQLGYPALLYAGETVHYMQPHETISHYLARHNLPSKLEPDLPGKMYSNIPKVLAFVPPERQDELLLVYRERFSGVAQVSRSSPGFIEVNSLGVTKASALKSLAETFGIPRENTAAIGDNYLDLEMIEWAGEGVCVADGAKEVKAAADRIIPACAEDGVAYYIENFVLPR